MLVGLSIDERFAAHEPPAQPDRPLGVPGHPEHPGRLSAIEAELRRRDLISRTTNIPARIATRAELERVHTAAWLDTLERTITTGKHGWFDNDTYYAPGSLEAAYLAAGATLDCALAVASGTVDSAFALVRPPGHHALADRAMGFCLVNNIAVAAAGVRARGRTTGENSRIAIFDWDVHHGNGTEAIFYEDGDVLYASMHEWPQYPGTGARIDVGRGAGIGATINVPMASGTTGSEYLAAFRASILPALARFAPDMLLVSAGFDAHKDDPLGGLQLDDDTYRTLTLELLAIQPKMALVLEGGYSLPALARSASLVIETLVDYSVVHNTSHPASPAEMDRPVGPGKLTATNP